MKFHNVAIGIMLNVMSAHAGEKMVSMSGKTKITFLAAGVLEKRLGEVGLTGFCGDSSLVRDLGGTETTIYKCVIAVDMAIKAYNEKADALGNSLMTDGCKEKIFSALLSDQVLVLEFLKKQKFYKEQDTCNGGS